MATNTLALERERALALAQAQLDLEKEQAATPGGQALSLAKEYGPYVGTGLGEDAAVAASLFANAGQMGANLAQGKGWYEGNMPERYQKAIETVTGAWPQPTSSPQQLAKYAGNALPLVPPAAYLALNYPWQTGLVGWLGNKAKKAITGRGILPKQLEGFF